MQINSAQFSRAETEVFLIKAVPRRASRNENGQRQLQRRQLAVGSRSETRLLLLTC